MHATEAAIKTLGQVRSPKKQDIDRHKCNYTCSLSSTMSLCAVRSAGIEQTCCAAVRTLCRLCTVYAICQGGPKN